MYLMNAFFKGSVTVKGTLDSELMKEGDMIGAEFSLTELEKKAEDRTRPLVVKIFLERVHLSLK